MSISLQTISCLFLWRRYHVSIYHVYFFADDIMFNLFLTVSSCLYFFADGVYLFADDHCISWLVLCRRFYVYFFADSIMSISLQTVSCLFLCRQYHDRLFCWRHHVLLFLCRRFYDYFFADGVVSFLSQPNYTLFKTTFTIELSTKRHQISQRKIHLRL